MAIFDDPSAAFKGGFDASQDVADSWRHTRAQNALARAYGPTVTSLQDAADQQTLNLNSQLDPLKVQAAQQGVDFDAANNPLKLQNQQLQNDNQGLQNTQAGQQIETNNMSIQATKALQLHGVLSSSLTNLGTQLANVTDPTQRGALFDAEIQNLAPLTGVDPRVLAAQVRAERDRIVKDGAAAVPAIQNDLDGLINGSLSPSDRQALANAKATGNLTQANIDKVKAQTAAVQAKAAAAASGKPVMTAAQQAKLDQQKHAASSSLADLKSSNANVNNAIDEALKDAEDPRATGPMANLANLPGVGAAANGPAYKLARVLDTIKGNIGFDKLQDIRANSPTGGSLGSISDFEEKLLQSTIASLDQAQDKGTLVKNLLKVRAALADTETRMTKAFGDDFGEQGGAPAAGTAPAGAVAPGTTPAAPGAAGGPASATYTFNPATGELE